MDLPDRTSGTPGRKPASGASRWGGETEETGDRVRVRTFFTHLFKLFEF